MNVFLANGDLIRGDYIGQWVLRSDLTPVPRSLELTVKDSVEMRGELKEGAILQTGYEMLKYRIVKVLRPAASGVVQGDFSLGVIQVTALLDMSVKVAQRSPKAIIKESRGLGEIYRSCGGESAIANDFTVARFSCFVGETPSHSIALALQEEAGAIVVRKGALSFLRISDMTKQTPALRFGQVDSSQSVESEFLENHEVASFFSLDDAGAVVKGDQRKVRALAYSPRSKPRVLFNLSRAIILRRMINAGFYPQVNAGDVVEVMGVPMVVITAAHVFEQGQNNPGQMNSYSKLWLGVPT